MEGLRDFLAGKLGETATQVIDRPNRGQRKNFVEGFVIETAHEVEPEWLLLVLRQYYSDGKIVVAGGNFHWVERPDQPKLLLNITNYSEPGGASYFGGNHHCGGIGIVVTEHPQR